MSLVPGGNQGGPIARADPTVTPSPSPASFDRHPFRALGPGAYVLEYIPPFRITFIVPEGWERLVPDDGSVSGLRRHEARVHDRP